jgi:hypothetical protein
VTYIDEHKHLFGVEPICQSLTSFGWPIASSTYRGCLPAAALGQGPPRRLVVRAALLRSPIEESGQA